MTTSTTQQISKDEPLARQLVDRITYLASLASKSEDIDPMLDTLRSVTAHWDQSTPANDQDTIALQELEKKLKYHLIHDDPLRSFTEESLEKRLQVQTSGRIGLNRNIKSLLVVLVASLLAAAAGFFAPPDSMSAANLVAFSVPLFFVALHIGIAWFYLTALKNFNQEIRKTFMVICAGILIFAVTFSHYAIISAFELNRFVVFRYGGITWLVTAPFILIFLGLSMYARQLGVVSRLLSPLVVLGVVAAVAIGVILMPHGPVKSEFYFDFWTIGAVMVMVFGSMGFVLAKKISKVVTPAYATPMKWLYRYLFLTGGPFTGIACVAVFVIGELQGNALYIVTAACGITPQLLLLYTGYSFKKETGK